MKRPKYIAFDCETGGIDPQLTLLTVHFEILNEDLESIDSLSLAIQPDNNVYHVTADALKINKIDLVQHHRTALPRKDACQRLYMLLSKYTQDGKYKLIPIGHCVTFDLNFVWTHLLQQTAWERFVNYRTLDTAVIGQFLQYSQKIPAHVTGSLMSYCKHFGISLEAAHTAKADIQATIEVLQAMRNIIIYDCGRK